MDAQIIAEMCCSPEGSVFCLVIFITSLGENLNQVVVVYWWRKPRDHILFRSREGDPLPFEMVSVLLIPLDKISVNDHAAANEELS